MNPLDLPGFEPTRALTLALASAQAYDPSADAITITDRATDTRILLLPGDGAVTAAFRGTADLRNWLTDLDCAKTTMRVGGANSGGSPIRVHAGFFRAWQGVRRKLGEALADMRLKTLWLTGHSLGGALAMLAAFDFVNNPRAGLPLGIRLAGCYTFGQPRVGNTAFRDIYNATVGSRTCRIVHADDVVPRVPWLLGSYRHAGHEVFAPLPGERGWNQNQFSDSDSGLRFLIDPSWVAKLPSDVRSLLQALARGRASCLESHHIHAYINLLAIAPAEIQAAPTPSPTSHLNF